MVTYTANKNLAEPARGEYLGTWDTPVNSNTTILDNSLGGYVAVPLSNANVVLSPAQYQNTFITFTSTAFGGLAASVTITLPAVGSFYTVQNLTSNTSSFTVTLATTAAGGQYIALPPGEPIDIFTDGTNVKFRNLGRVGSYWDYAGSSIPNWVSGCSIPPYLNCDGSAFSSAAYPVLATVLGGTTLPDSRGRVRAALNQGTARITTVISSDIVGASGGDQNYPQHNHPAYIYDPGHYHGIVGVWTGPAGASGQGGSGQNLSTIASPWPTQSATTGVRVTSVAGSTTPNDMTANSGTGTGGNLQPTYIGGLTLIRAA